MPDLDSYPTASAVNDADRVILRQTDNDGSVHTRKVVRSALAAPSIAGNLTATSGGSIGALLLPKAENIVRTGGAGTGVRFNPAFPRQKVWNRTGGDLLLFPATGTTVEGATSVTMSSIAKIEGVFDQISDWVVG